MKRLQDRAEWGKVYFCPTPLGNLKDITLRTLETLQTVDFVACEDTRVTLKLLNYYQIKKPLFSYHKHNFKNASQKIIALTKEGRSIAVVSDAGTPGIQDPGAELIKLLIQEEIAFEVLPGPSALILALVYSGFSDQKFLFLGFLPRNRKERANLLKSALNSPYTVIIYEAPHRLINTLQEILQIENRDTALCRELTKYHQEVLYGKTDEILRSIGSNEQIKGEITLVLKGKEKVELETSIESIGRMVALLQSKGLSDREIVTLVHEAFQIGKNKIKKLLEKEKTS